MCWFKICPQFRFLSHYLHLLQSRWSSFYFWLITLLSAWERMLILASNLTSMASKACKLAFNVLFPEYFNYSFKMFDYLHHIMFYSSFTIVCRLCLQLCHGFEFILQCWPQSFSALTLSRMNLYWLKELNPRKIWILIGNDRGAKSIQTQFKIVLRFLPPP
jgi:hypothetical protein